MYFKKVKSTLLNSFSIGYGFILLIAFVAMSKSNLLSATYYVNSSTGNDLNAGTAGAPFKTFTKAYTVSANGDAINLTGTFDWSSADETGDVSVSGFTLSKSLTIQGQSASSTIIQAASVRNTADRRVFTVNAGFAVTIKNLTLRYGRPGTNQSGGGLLINSSNQIVSLENLRIEKNDLNNSSGYNFGGGGIAIFNSNSTSDINITNCEISDNSTSAWGGGIYTSGVSGTSSNKTIIRNTTISSNVSGEWGGAIAGYYGRNFVMINSTLSMNTGYSAVIFSNHNSGSVYFLNNTIAYNTTLYNSAYLEFVNAATLQNNIIVENRNTSNVLQGYITQRNVVPSYYNNFIDLIPTNWAASNDVQNGVNGNIVGLNHVHGLSNVLNSNSSSLNTKTLSLSSSSVAINTGSSVDYGYSVPTADQRGFYRLDAVDIGSYEFSGTGLPVELTSFNAVCSDEKSVNVSWSTASEHNSSYFDVMKSEDGHNWRSVSIVSAAGNSVNNIDYGIVDAEKMNGTVYYKLMQYDIDGKSKEYGPISSTCATLNEMVVKTYPNPSGQEFFVEIIAPESTTTIIAILDAQGKMVQSRTVDTHKGTNIYTFADLNILPGMYYIQISNDLATPNVVKHSFR